MKRRILLLASMLTLCTSAARAADSDVVIDKSHSFVAQDNKAQHFSDYIDLATGQERLPLFFNMTNGDKVSPPYTWIRVSVAGRPFLTEKDFKGNRTLSLNVTGSIGSGSSQLLILAGGVPGATASWTLTTPQVTLDSAKPDKVPAGQPLTINGKHFNKLAQLDKVTVGGKLAQVNNATESALTITVPLDAKAGKNLISVSVCGITAPRQIEVTITNKPPKVASLSLISGAPSQVVTISGSNFSSKASENKVTIGGAAANVLSASESSISCEIPLALDAANNPTWDLPVVVEVNGVKSNNDVTMNVQMRNIPAGEVSPTGGPWN